jgi:hypothetical protein
MRTPLPAASSRRRPARRRRLAVLTASIALLLAVAACAPGAPADGPGAVVNEAMAKVAAKDVDGLRTLACAGQEDLIRDQLGFSEVLGAGDLIPGMDVQALLDAVNLDVKGVRLGDPAIDGDVAQVPVTGTLKVTFDAVAMKPILRQVLDSQGTTMTDEQLDALLKTLASYGQDIPLEQSVRLVREAGAWKICQDSVVVPAAS